MKKRTPEEAGSMPWDAPLVPDFPFAFHNVDVLTLSYRTLPGAISEILPPPLKATSDRVLIHIYNMRDVEWLGSYGECNVMVGAELPKKAKGGYSPYLFLDSDVGLAHGREVHGQPKKFGESRVEVRRDLFVGTVTRNGIDIITGTMGYKQEKGTLEEFKKKTFDFSVNLNYKVISHIDGKPAIRQITSRKLSDVRVHECWVGPCTVELRPNAQAPVFKLPVVEMGQGLFWRADFTLVKGSVVHDYLR
ncbi:MAG: acetoacetate decarboxylase family protein [Ignavibacteriales bacterium]|nr:acetoacetate decarboxylase family protein [Ignavibacteriales bacterium]